MISRNFQTLTVAFGNIVDELHDENCLADASTTEKTNFPPFLIWGKQVDDLKSKSNQNAIHKRWQYLNSSDKHFHFSRLINERRRLTVNRER